ncbi:MAG: class I SAM-dependent methyltransferase [Bacteroides sp.]
MNKLNITACPLCDGTHRKRVMTCKDFYASGESFDVCTCEDCGFTFTQGAPVEAEMGRYYETPDYISHSDTKKGAMNALYHQVRRYMLGRKARLVMKEAHRKEGHLLDIGTGTGYFADAMLQRNWKVEAVEKNAHARLFAREHFGLEVKEETALQTFAPETFDVITLWHVMEHLEALNDTWERLHQLLTEKGILVVAVPNCSSFDAAKYGKQWAAYDVPRHLWHFTPTTMQRMAFKHGFIMAARHPMPFDAFYVSMLSEKNLGHGLPFFRGMTTGTIAWLRALTRKEQSSSMIYIFRKKTIKP